MSAALGPPVLATLLRAESARPLDRLARDMETSVSAVRGALAQLERDGCTIAYTPAGATLGATGLSAWRDYLVWRFGARRPIEVYGQLKSTQDTARRLLANRGAEADGGIVVADEQRAGRGRLGRRWSAPPGTAVLVSRVCVRPGALERLVCAGALAVAWALEEVAGRGLEARIRWPNDVMLTEKKIAGLLVERAPIPGGEAAVLGCGVNVTLDPEALAQEMPEAPRTITSLARAEAPCADRLRVLEALVEALDVALVEPADRLRRAWRTRSTLLGRRACFARGGERVEGEVLDLDVEHGLLVRALSGTTRHVEAAGTSLLHVS